MLHRTRLLLRSGSRCTVRSAAAGPNTCRLRRLAVRAYSNQATFARCALSVRGGPASGIALTATHTPIEATGTVGGRGSTTTTQAPLTVHLVPALDDNYTFLVEAEGGRRFVVDPAEPAPVLAALQALGWVGTVDAVLITHHHHDHVGGTLAVKEQCGRSRGDGGSGGGGGGKGGGCVVIGPEHHAASPGSEPIPGLDHAVGEGDDLALLPAFAGAPPAAVPRVLATPGHTLDHLSFVFDGGALAAGPALFCGDTLFSLGCGRLFEGTADAMFESLGKLRALPGSTAVYCGHEYTESNAVFAMDLLLRQGQFPGASTGDGPAQAPDAAVPRLLVPRRASEVLGLRRLGLPTLPVSLCDELAANPFLRARTAGELAAVRARKDAFRPTETLEALVDAMAGAAAPASTP